MRLTPGTRVGPYEVVALLGAGGMAEVYRAKDTRLAREVAIKVVSETFGANAAFQERFEREAKLAASLAHPNVVALYDVGFQDGKPYFVTELLQGETLRERLAKGPIPLNKALEWAAQIAQGLAAAHERGIVHRDLKPENVFITKDGHVKLLDFGIAKLVEAVQAATPHGLMEPTVSPSGSITGTGMVLGTPGYMSPEQVRGDPVDARTDFFSLGAVLYEMLTGRRAFPSGPLAESGYAILHNEPEALGSAVPPQVAHVAERCLEKDPARRFQSARDLAFNLDLVRAPTGPAAPTASTPAAGAAGHRFRQWRTWLWPAGLVLAALVAGAVMYFVGRDTRLPPPTVQSLVARLGRVSAGRFNPDGRVIFSAAWEGQPLEIFAQAPGHVDAQSLGLRDCALLSVSRTGELAILVRPEWIFEGERGTLAVVPGAGGTPRELAESVPWADWTPSGELAIARWVSGHYQLEFPLGKVVYQAEVAIFSPRVSPSGDTVAFSDSTTGNLLLVDRNGQTRIVAAKAEAFHLAWSPDGKEVWFTSFDGAIWAANVRSGARRLVYQGVFPMDLEDISADGRVLVNAMERRWEVTFAPPGKQPQLRLSLEDSFEPTVSDDGRQVLFSTEHRSQLRPTNGGLPLDLGPGAEMALSPDGKWVLAMADNTTDTLTLLPVGAGSPKVFHLPGFVVYFGRFFHDGRGIAIIGRHAPDRDFHLYGLALDGGMPVEMSDAGVFGYYHFQLSRDDGLVAALNVDEILTLYPTDGGSPVPLTELGKNHPEPVAWNAEGQLWVRPKVLQGLPTRLLLYDVSKRRVVRERPFTLDDPAGVLAVWSVSATADGNAIAFGYQRELGHLYVMDGLNPPRR